MSARQAAINTELEARLDRVQQISSAERELHQIRKREAEIRCQIAEEQLTKARIETENEKELCLLRLQFAREKQEIELQILKKKLNCD